MTSSVSGVSGPPPIDWPGTKTARNTSPPPPPVVGSAGAAPMARAPVSAEQLHQVAQQLQKYLQDTGRTMQFSVDKITGTTIVRIYNSSSGELVRQVPSEEIVHLAELLRQEDRHSTFSAEA